MNMMTGMQLATGLAIGRLWRWWLQQPLSCGVAHCNCELCEWHYR